MLFNTLDFWIFFAHILPAYLVLRRRAQNVLLLLGSYFFYACWDWRVLGLLLLSTSTDWLAGEATSPRRVPPGRAGLRLPDLLRLLRLHRHRPRGGSHHGLPADGQLQPPLLRHLHHRFLAALAHQPLHLAARLSLCSA